MNKIIKKTVIFGIVFLAAAGNSIAVSNLTVHVKDGAGNPLGGVQVAVFNFTLSGEPDVNYSDIAYTDPVGDASFSIEDSKEYVILASSHGYLPTLQEQMDAPLCQFSVNPGTVAIALTEGDAAFKDSHIVILSTVTIFPGYAPTIVFGQVTLNAGNEKEDIAFGALKISDNVNGQGVIKIVNVPDYRTEDYSFGCFSPAMNAGMEQPITISTMTASPYEAPALDLTSEDANAAEGTSGGGTYDAAEILRGTVYNTDGIGVGNAEVGVYFDFEASYLDNGTTYYYHDWRDYTAWTDSYGRYAVYSDVDFTSVEQVDQLEVTAWKKGYVSVSTYPDTGSFLGAQNPTSTFRVHFMDGNALETAGGSISGTLKRGGYPLAEGHINIDEDWSTWNIEGSTYVYMQQPASGWGESRVNSDGSFSITGLSPGNYYINVWSDFSDGDYLYNRGPNGSFDTLSGEVTITDGQTQWPDWRSDIHTRGSDDLRVNLSTENIVTVYSSTGAVISTGPVTIDLPGREIAGSSATITGTLIPPAGAATLDSPVGIMVYENWNSFDESILETEDVTVSSYPTGEYYLKLSHSGVDENSGVQSLYDVTIGTSVETWDWIEWDKDGNSYIMWNNGETNPDAPAIGDVLHAEYYYKYNPFGNMTVVPSSTANLTFEINVEANRIYELDFKPGDYSILWRPGQHDLVEYIDTSTTALPSGIRDVGDIELIPGGKINGVFKKPDGSILKPVEKEIGAMGTTNWYRANVELRVEAEGVNVDSWGNVKVGSDGKFLIEGLRPGDYRLELEPEIWAEIDWNAWDTAGLTLEIENREDELYDELRRKFNWVVPYDTIKVISSTNPVNVTVNVKEGIRIEPVMEAPDTTGNIVTIEGSTYTPDSYFYESTYRKLAEYIPGDEFHGGEGGVIGVFGIPAGTKRTPALLLSMFMSDNMAGSGYISQKLADEINNIMGSTVAAKGWSGDESGIIPADYDFYAGASRAFDPEMGIGDWNFIFCSSKKNVTISRDNAAEVSGAYEQQVPMDNIEFGDAVLEGRILGNDIFTDENMELLKGKAAGSDGPPQEFMELIPGVMLYDSDNRLRGFSIELPPTSEFGEDEVIAMMEAINLGDKQTLQDILISTSTMYRLPFLKPGNYTAVYFSANYPAVTKQVTLEPGINRLDIDLDLGGEAGAEPVYEVSYATIAAKFVAADTTAPVSGVTVDITGPGIDTTYTSNSAGEVTIRRLKKGIYYVMIEASGYARKGVKVVVDKYDTFSRTIELYPGTEHIYGQVNEDTGETVFGIPVTVGVGEAEIVAFDTDRGQDLVGLYHAISLSDDQPDNPSIYDEKGDYYLSGLQEGHTYDVWMLYPGYKVLGVTHQAYSTSALKGYNFTLENLDPKFSINYRLDNSTAYLKVTSNKSLAGPPELKWQEGETWIDEAGSSISLVNPSAKSWTGSFTVSAGNKYILRATGVDSLGAGATKYVTIDMLYPNSLIKTIDEIIAQGGEVELDEEGKDTSSIYIPTGSLEESGGSASSVMAMTSLGEETTVSAQALGGLASMIFRKQSVVGSLEDAVGDIYEVELDNASIREGKSVTLNLAYDFSRLEEAAGGAINENMINVRRKNDSTGVWDVVEGQISHDSAGRLVSIEVNNLNSASAASAASYSAQSGSQGGEYAVFYGIPSEQSGPADYDGDKFRAYNFPNPFNLERKSVTLANSGSSLSASQEVDGTVIKYYLPSSADNDAEVKFHIYNVAGELVRTISEPERDGGKIYFTEWDGKNDSGSKVASGVYLLLSEINGDIKDDVLKMAIIK